MTDHESNEQRRRHFRLPYPIGGRPKLICRGKAHEVVEIAEGGIRLVIKPDEAMRVDDWISGDISFNDGESEFVCGKVLRLASQNAVIQLTQYISQNRVMREQRYLRKQALDL